MNIVLAMAALHWREHAHPFNIYQADGFSGTTWGTTSFTGGPTALLQHKPNAAPGVLWSARANNRDYTIGMRFHDVVNSTAGTYEALRKFHPITNEDIYHPMGLGGKHNTHNPYHAQIPDPAGNFVLDITTEIWYDPAQGLNTTFRSSVIAKKFVVIAYNLNGDGKRVASDNLLGYPYKRWPTAATAPAGWPAAFVQPAGGRVMSQRDAIYHFCRQGGICAHPHCRTPLNFRAPEGDPNAASIARKNDMINHYGMESLTAADDNILGWVCSHCKSE